jgi:hypothetical protein
MINVEDGIFGGEIEILARLVSSLLLFIMGIDTSAASSSHRRAGPNSTLMSRHISFFWHVNSFLSPYCPRRIRLTPRSSSSLRRWGSIPPISSVLVGISLPGIRQPVRCMLTSMSCLPENGIFSGYSLLINSSAHGSSIGKEKPNKHWLIFVIFSV